MNPSARKAWCRSAFFALCVLPTLLVCCWTVSRAFWETRAATAADWERGLTQRLGLQVTIGEVAYPELAIAELRQVEMADAETGEILARAEGIEISRAEAGWSIKTVALEIEAARLGRLAQILHDRVLCGGPAQHDACEFSARELTLNDGRLPQSIFNVHAALERTETGPRLVTCFQWPQADTEEHTVSCTLSRNCTLSPPATSMTVDTGKSAIPCRLAASFWQPLARLGEEAECRGQMRAILSPGATAAEVHGTLSHVDLDALVSEQFPHVLSGQGLVTLEKLQVEGGRLLSAAGTMEVNAGGRISRSLLVAAERHMQLKNDADESGPEIVPFRRLAIGFRIDGERLRLSGSADASAPGVLITNHTGPILEVPPKHAVSAVALARVLVPDSQVQVPATEQTRALVRLLPVPSLAPAQSARRAHVPTRLAPSTGSSGGVIRER